MSYIVDLQGFPLVYYCISLLDYKDSETNRHIEYNSLYLRYSIKA